MTVILQPAGLHITTVACQMQTLRNFGPLEGHPQNVGDPTIFRRNPQGKHFPPIPHIPYMPNPHRTEPGRLSVKLTLRLKIC